MRGHLPLSLAKFDPNRSERRYSSDAIANTDTDSDAKHDLQWHYDDHEEYDADGDRFHHVDWLRDADADRLDHVDKLSDSVRNRHNNVYWHRNADGNPKSDTDGKCSGHTVWHSIGKLDSRQNAYPVTQSYAIAQWYVHHKPVGDGDCKFWADSERLSERFPVSVNIAVSEPVAAQLGHALTNPNTSCHALSHS